MKFICFVGMLSLAQWLMLLNPAYSQSSISNNIGNKIGVGLELGGAPTFLFSNSELQAFGLGVGSQFGVYGTYRNDKPIAIKMRIDHVFLREEAMNRAEMDYFVGDTYLKAMTQEYTMIGVGAEFREPGAGDMFFYEALLGYAIGVSGSVEVTPKNGSSHIEGRKVALNSSVYLAGGAGIRRKLIENLMGVATARTFILLGSPYAGELTGKAYFPLPVLLSVGAEYLF